jgi:carotenoid 1,2-hydratase
MSDDGQHALTLIAFVGSVFSPYYAHARRKSHRSNDASVARGTNPEEFCAINAALYRGVDTAGPRARNGYWWAMTEHSRHSLERDADSMRVGQSAFLSRDDTLIIELNEITVPYPRRVRGRIYVELAQQCEESYPLAQQGGHLWRPIAPSAKIRVELTDPPMQWEGRAYVDSNRGDAPLESAFREWTWTRTHEVRDDGTLDEATRVFYEVMTNTGERRQISASFSHDCAAGAAGTHGEPRENRESSRSIVSSSAPVPTSHLLDQTLWGITRSLPCDPERDCRVLKTVESAPFYARSIIETTLGGRVHRGMHESLSMARFEKRWVQCLLPFKMPRLR